MSKNLILTILAMVLVAGGLIFYITTNKQTKNEPKYGTIAKVEEDKEESLDTLNPTAVEPAPSPQATFFAGDIAVQILSKERLTSFNRSGAGGPEVQSGELQPEGENLVLPNNLFLAILVRVKANENIGTVDLSTWRLESNGQSYAPRQDVMQLFNPFPVSNLSKEDEFTYYVVFDEEPSVFEGDVKLTIQSMSEDTTVTVNLGDF